MENPFHKKIGVAAKPEPEPPEEFVISSESMVGEALKIRQGNREQVYGHPAQNFTTIAHFWSAWLSVRLKAECLLDGADVGYMMQLMKLARLANSPRHRDSQVDVIGYADCVDMVIAHEKANPLDS